MIKRVFLILVLTQLLGMAACTTVKPYERIYLNDEDMELKARLVEFNEQSAESYREGGAGANGGKAGGGCGCN